MQLDLAHDSGSFYAQASTTLRSDLVRALGRPTIQALQRRQPLRHFLVCLRTMLLLGLGAVGAAHGKALYAWLPCSIVTGFSIFAFTVLLHEVVHHAVFEHRPKANRLLGWLYAFPSGVSPTQFTRWHLDHHAQLGDPLADPKRHHLSPQRNARWLKALYLTPALFFIYFRAAARETRTYPPALQRQIRRERLAVLLGQGALLTLLLLKAGLFVAYKVYLVPYVFVFPVAFTLNRVGQHYSIDPSDPARWSTLLTPSWFWDVVFIGSRYHLEHHYLPGVPFYNLPRLHRALRPFYSARKMNATGYAQLLWAWFVENRAPHTRWSPH